MWAIVRCVLAVTGLLVAVAGFAVFVGAAVGVWKVKAETNRRTDALAVKAHEAMNTADQGVGFVHKVIDQADQDLERARKKKPAAPAEPVNPFLQLTARKASADLAGSVERANTAVVTAADAAAVAQAALQVFGEKSELPALKEWLGVKPEQLAQTRGHLENATRELNQVRTVLGVPLGEGGPTQEQLRTVESGLAQARELTNQVGQVVATARTQVDETKRSVDLWALRVALGVTLVGGVGAVGQFFMARFCWRVLRGKPA
jgi:hydrogenase maturation protease